MKELRVEGGNWIDSVITRLVAEAPAWCVFNDIRLEAGVGATKDSVWDQWTSQSRALAEANKREEDQKRATDIAAWEARIRTDERKRIATWLRARYHDSYTDKIADLVELDQVKEYEPPPNPAKMSDPRAEGYVAEYGDESWEVDALPPDVLSKIIREALDELVDREKMDAVIAQEELDKERLRDAAQDL